MTVSVTHAQQLTITTSTTNPIVPNAGSTATPVVIMHHQTSLSSPPSCNSSGHSSDTATDPQPQQQQQHSSNHQRSSNNNSNSNTSSSNNTSSSSASSSALRRLYFKSGRNAKTRQTPIVPKVVVMGSSSTSEATINTSTESTSTLVTNITTTDTETIDSLDLGDTSGQSEPLLSSSLDENQPVSITSETDSIERDEINSIVAAAITNIEYDRDSLLISYEEIPLHPYKKSPQTAPLSTSTCFHFDPPASPKSVRNYEKNQNLFTFEHDDYRCSSDKIQSKKSICNNENDKENEMIENYSKDHHHDKKSKKTSRKERYCMNSKKISSAPPVDPNSKCVNFNEKNVPTTMFPFDREAIDYDRIQKDCFAVEDETKFIYDPLPNEYTNDYYENIKRDCFSPSEIFHQYTLLSQEENYYKYDDHNHYYSQHQQQQRHPPNRSSSKRNRTESAPRTKFDEISSRFDQLSPPVFYDNNNTSVVVVKTISPRSTPPLPDLRIDYFNETTKVAPPITTQPLHNTSSSSSSSATQPDDTLIMLAGCQKYNTNTMHSNSSSSSSNSSGGPINVTSNPMDTAVYTQPRATIVVQQASLSLDNTVETYLLKNEGDFISVEQGKELRKKKQREENMRQLLDVTNTFTLEEIRDFEMRYGSPHHSRSQSVKTPGSRASGRPNQLTLPQQRSRVASMPNTGVEEEYYRLRHFSITGKGVINRGDSLKSRRSRSNNSVTSSNSSTEHLTAIPTITNTGFGGGTHQQGGSRNNTESGIGGGGGGSNSKKTSATCSLASSRESSTSNPGTIPYRVLMLGGSSVGKSSLVSQFMTSEYLHAYDTSIDDDTGEKSVSVLLSGEESELVFIDHPHSEIMPDNCFSAYEPHGYCVIYSSADKSSFVIAERILQTLWTSENISQKAVILVGNKADLARSRVITPEEGKSMATAYDCKFIETSVGINHNVDELLVGILSQIRLKLENPEKTRDLFRKRSTRKSKRRACSPLGGAATACLSGSGGTTSSTPVTSIGFNDFSTPPGSAQSSPRKYRGSRTSASLKVKGLLGRVWARDSKSKSCENLHVL